MTSSPTIQRLADILEISSVRPRFGRAADMRDFAAMEGLFQPEVFADMSEFGIPASTLARTDLVAMFRHAFRHEGVKTQQLYGSVAVEVDGDVATCRSYLRGLHVGKDFPGGDTFELHAEYTDQLDRTDTGWRIAQTRLRVISVTGNLGLVS
jgi:SnoaL-like domain